MIYKITFSCEEVDGFRMVFEANPDSTFLELHKAILSAVKYTDDQMTSFFMCNDQWEKGQEVTLVEMDNNFEYDNMVMEETHLNDLMLEQGQRLIYIFDPMFERYFFGSLREIVAGDIEGVRLAEKKGRAPKQLQTDDGLAGIVGKDGRAEWETEEDFYGDSAYDAEELDMEGFQDLSFEDGSMF
ncbi:MAG: hypothetical protein MJZ75_00130 [Paludibacteraceae bacterium]|nr:hypothetical protein [Paludibacteraceae bacterium]